MLIGHWEKACGHSGGRKRPGECTWAPDARGDTALVTVRWASWRVGVVAGV